MASIFYGINAGAEDSTVTIASTTTGKDVEIAINTVANVPSRDAVELLVEKLKVALIRAPYTPI